jgi:hypothetical protein
VYRTRVNVKRTFVPWLRQVVALIPHSMSHNSSRAYCCSQKVWRARYNFRRIPVDLAESQPSIRSRGMRVERLRGLE